MSVLLSKTLELLRASRLPVDTIARDCDLKVSFINRLKTPSNKSIPAVDACEKLYVYLSGKELEL
jgi:hypothetical protein